MVDPDSQMNKSLQIQYITDCGPDNVCQPNLTTITYFEKYVIL